MFVFEPALAATVPLQITLIVPSTPSCDVSHTRPAGVLGRFTDENEPENPSASNRSNVSFNCNAAPRFATVNVPPYASVPPPLTTTNLSAFGAAPRLISIEVVPLSVGALLNVSVPIDVPGATVAPLATTIVPLTPPFPFSVWPLAKV
jgi:hypothetical protein